LQLPEITNQYQVLASYGVNGLTSEHLEAIKDLKALQEIIFFFDGDSAGREGVKRMSEDINRLFPGVRITSVNTPENEDINSLYTAHSEKASELFKHLLNERKEVAFSDTSSTSESFSFSNENLSDEKKKLPAPPKTSTSSFNPSNPHRIT